MGFLKRKVAESLDLRIRRLYLQRLSEMASFYGNDQHPDGVETAVEFHRIAMKWARAQADPHRTLVSPEGVQQVMRLEAGLLAETGHALGLDPVAVMDEYARTDGR